MLIMAYIFLDESGDLGFDSEKRGASQYFVVTLLCCDDKRPIEKAVKSVHTSLTRTCQRRGGVLHCYREKPVTRNRLLSKLSNKEMKVMAIYLNKKKVYTKLQDQKDVLYNFVTNILLDRIFTKKLVPLDDQITLVASRKETSRFLNLNFKNFLANQVKLKHKLNFNVEIKTPHEEKALQAVDFLSWSIFRKYEYQDESYYGIFKHQIIEENILFK